MLFGKSVRGNSDDLIKDQVKQGAILRVFSSKDFFLPDRLVLRIITTRPDRVESSDCFYSLLKMRSRCHKDFVLNSVKIHLNFLEAFLTGSSKAG